MDSFAVSISNGLVIKKIELKQTLTIALIFALFHALMPLFGWLAGSFLGNYISKIDHWIAFALLTFIGTKMIYEAITTPKEPEPKESKIQIITILTQALAVSIDAFAIGITFALLKQSIIIPTIIISLTTLIVSIIGLQIGKICGDKLGKYAEIIGGIILITIGIKIAIAL